PVPGASGPPTRSVRLKSHKLLVSSSVPNHPAAPEHTQLLEAVMRKTILSLAIAGAMLIAMPGSGYAQAKIKIAIWEFENHAETSWWSHNDMGPAARNTIDTEFSENKLLSDKFSVVERDKLNMVLKEQGLAQSGAVDPASAAKVGKILGVKYIVLGGI